MQEEPNRIAHIIGKWIGGGVEAVVMNYYRSIEHSKIQFDFICDQDSTNIPYEEIEKLGGRVILIPPYQKIFKYQKALTKIFKENKYRIVHSHINTLSVFPLRIAKKNKIPIRIAHNHSTSNKKEWKKNILKNILRPLSKKYATNYMCCSEIAGRYLFGNKTYNEGKVYMLNNAIDVEKYIFNEKSRKEKRKELGAKDSTLIIGHIGRFVTQKNHNFLIDVFNEIHKKNKDSILILVGKGPLEDKVKQKIEKLGLRDVVKFLGQRNDTKELYQVFDVFLLPSLYEGLGMVLIEAQVSNCYCIASTKVPNNVKCIEKFDFIDLNKSAKEWANTILNKKDIQERRSNKQKIADCGFDIEKEVKKLESYYDKEMKIKVCHVVSGLVAGGVESMIYNYCNHMEFSKYEWHLLYQHEPFQKNVEEFEKMKFKLARIPSKVRHPIKNYRNTYNYLKENKIDVVHCHMTLTNFIPLIAAKRIGIKVRICHSHNSDVRKKSIIVKMIESVLKWMSIHNATNLIACGDDAGKYMYKERKFVILHNAINIESFEYNESKRKKIREIYKISSTTKIIGHVGRMTNQKNHNFLINVFNEVQKENKDVVLMLIGEGELRKNIEKEVEELKLQNKVIFVGIVPNVNEYYSAFDLFVLPSLWEGVPVSNIEAQVAGLRCLLSNKIDNNAVIYKEKCKVLQLNETIWKEEIIKNLKQSNNRSLDEKIIEQKNLSLDKEVEKLVNIYNI